MSVHGTSWETMREHQMNKQKMMVSGECKLMRGTVKCAALIVQAHECSLCTVLVQKLQSSAGRTPRPLRQPLAGMTTCLKPSTMCTQHGQPSVTGMSAHNSCHTYCDTVSPIQSQQTSGPQTYMMLQQIVRVTFQTTPFVQVQTPTCAPHFIDPAAPWSDWRETLTSKCFRPLVLITCGGPS